MSKSKLVALVILGVVFFALGLYFNSVGMFDHMNEPPASWQREAERIDRAENAKAEERAAAERAAAEARVYHHAGVAERAAAAPQRPAPQRDATAR